MSNAISKEKPVNPSSPVQPCDALLWSGRRLSVGARKAFQGEGPLKKSIAARLRKLLEKVESQAISRPVRCPVFRIDPEIVTRFKEDDTESYWRMTLADLNGEQNARPLPAYLYMERDCPAFLQAFTEIREAFTAPMELTLAGFAFGRDDLLDKALSIWRDILDWEPGGLCNDWHGDTISTRLCLHLVRIAFWQSERLSASDWEKLGAMLQWRMKEGFEFLEFFQIDRFPLDSHIASAAAHFATVALAAEARFPFLKEYADWARRAILPIFPIWGGEDGGWAAGVNYWRWSTSAWLLMADLYPKGSPLSEHPWIRNTGWFKLYAHPPHSTQGAFGDHSDVPPLGLDAAILLYLGARYDTGPFVGYAEKVSQIPPHGCDDPGPAFSEVEALSMELAALSILRDGSDTSTQSLPGTRHFSDTGIVASHLHLGDETRNVMVLFRSSRWGSFNHAHADQNSFVLEAWREPILIDSGYYPSYHHPHAKQFSIQTVAHNAILVNGIGQTIRNIHAKGKIVSFETSDKADRFTGDATEAYGGRCRRVLRHVRFEKEAAVPFLILMDVVETVHPHTIEWLLHSYERFEIDEENNAALATGWRKHGGTARAKIHVLTPSRLYWRQTDTFPAPAEEREINKAKQWHLTVTPKDYFTRSVFLAAIQVGREDSAWKTPTSSDGPDGWQVAVGGQRFRCDLEKGILPLQ